ncbi:MULTISPECIES: zf-TFIIB domain-containing protein [Microbulbifer]|uniref:TFIIB-type zinc ribbon-containing protein n=1 Tax=Microbulbifer TaxID=48073 RepID=UPI001E42C71D|nr:MULTISPECIES: zf-TFIIB domain-containing protein [Microbulbifer]UHQ55228.1 zf-TFIIB domain-containing protein [Microbulbifer sp. YPW16]
MNCPSCKESGLMAMDRNGVQIDYCPNCRGIWLDHGELEKIIEKSHAAGLSDAGHPQEPHKQKRNLITELFDF